MAEILYAQRGRGEDLVAITPLSYCVQDTSVKLSSGETLDMIESEKSKEFQLYCPILHSSVSVSVGVNGRYMKASCNNTKCDHWSAAAALGEVSKRGR
jgi:hypothetical protein